MADLIGARRTFLIGLGLFVVASVGCALAGSSTLLIAARVAQGLGAALLSPAALALLTTVTASGAARRRAIGTWTATAAIGGASGWVLGGLLTQYWGWPAVFWVNVPLGLVALAAAPFVLPMVEPGGGRSLDLGGALGLTVALGALGFGLTSATSHGVLATTTLAPVGGALLLLVLTVRYESRHLAPIIPARLVRSRPVLAGGLTAALLTGTTSPAMLLSVLYAQQVLGYSPARAALLFPAFNLAVIAGSLLSPHGLRRGGPRRILVAGFAVIVGGVGLLVSLPAGPAAEGGAVLQLIGAFVATGFGLGLASVASTHVGTESVSPADRGVSSGVLTAAAQIGAALGMALLLPLASSAAPAGGNSFRIGYLACGVVGAAGLLAGLLAPAAGPSRSAVGDGGSPDEKRPSVSRLRAEGTAES